MKHSHRIRLEVYCKRLSMILALGITVPAIAQDGARPTGVPARVTKEVQEVQRSNPPVSPSVIPGGVLPPVPASINDPAPIGTRSVDVSPGAPGVVEGRNLQPTRAQLAGIHRAEGVVVAVEPPVEKDDSSKSLGHELIRLKFDPNQSWLQFSTEGPQNSSEAPQLKPTDPVRETTNDDPKDRDQTPTRPEADSASPGGLTSPVMTLVITKNTKLFVHARTRDGQDLYGVPTISSPNNDHHGEGVSGRLPARQPQASETNFTNIREGSFLSVRYRMVGNLAEAVNVNLIEYPVVTPGESNSVPGPVPGAVPGTRVSPSVRPSGVAPAGVPTRVPVVPSQTASPGTLPK